MAHIERCLPNLAFVRTYPALTVTYHIYKLKVHLSSIDPNTTSQKPAKVMSIFATRMSFSLWTPLGQAVVMYFKGRQSSWVPFQVRCYFG